jgi:hypothetical protein
MKAIYVPLRPDASANSSGGDAVSESKDEDRIRIVCDRRVAYLREVSVCLPVRRWYSRM